MTSLSHVHGDLSRSGVTHAPYEQALFGELDAAIRHYNAAPDALIQYLHRAQELFGYLREDVVTYVARRLRLPISHVHGVIGFYSFFSRVPPGKHTIQVCLGTPCYVQGAAQLLRGLTKELHIQPGQTTPDGRFSLRCVRCLGACGHCAVVTIGRDAVHRRLKSEGIKETLRHYK